jgi:hypothetical protein
VLAALCLLTVVSVSSGASAAYADGSGSIAIQAQWIAFDGSGTGPDVKFMAGGDGIPVTFTLSSGSPAHVGTSLDALGGGPFTFRQAAIPGWTLQSASCAGATASTVSFSQGGLTIAHLAPGEHVACTFANVQNSTGNQSRRVSVMVVPGSGGRSEAPAPFSGSIGGKPFEAMLGADPTTLVGVSPAVPTLITLDQANLQGFATIGFAYALPGAMCPQELDAYRGTGAILMPPGADDETVCIMEFKPAPPAVAPLSLSLTSGYCLGGGAGAAFHFVELDTAAGSGGLLTVVYSTGASPPATLRVSEDPGFDHASWTFTIAGSGSIVVNAASTPNAIWDGVQGGSHAALVCP